MISEQKSAYIDEYKIEKVLGSGYHAQVLLGVDQKGCKVAIKKYKPATATLNTLKNQLTVMREIKHENIVQLLSVREHAVFKHSNETVEKCFAIVLEYVGGGELFDFIAETGEFSELVTRTYFHQIMKGIHCIHTKGFAHRDIKPQNILISQRFQLKIADFGFAHKLNENCDKFLYTKLGTEGYMAPEIVSHNYEGKAVDIFAAGVILFIMYAGSPPFERATPEDPYYKLLMFQKQTVFWKAHERRRNKHFFSEGFKSLFMGMVAFQPKNRLNILQISKHLWVTQKIASYEQIFEQFSRRQSQLNEKLNEKNIQKKNASMNRAIQIQEQGSLNRDASSSNDRFLDFYNKEILQKKNNLIFEKQNTDFLYKGQLAIIIAQIKLFIAQHTIRLCLDEEFEDQSELIQCTKVIQDPHINKLNVNYKHYFEVDEEINESSLQIQISFGNDNNGNNIIRFKKVYGNYFFYKKIVFDIKQKAFLF